MNNMSIEKNETINKIVKKKKKTLFLKKEFN